MVNILERVPKLLADAFIEATKKILKIDEDSILKSASTIAGQIILLGINNFVPSIIGIVLQSFVKVTDSELKNISKQVSKLIREPLLTGLDQLKSSIIAIPRNEQEKGFQQARLRSALENFDKAFHLCDEHDKANIELLRIITLLKLEDGNNEAKLRIRNFIELTLQRKNKLEIDLKTVEISLIEKRKKEQTLNVLPSREGGELIGFSGSENYLNKMELLNSINQLELYHKGIMNELLELETILTSIKVTYELLN